MQVLCSGRKSAEWLTGYTMQVLCSGRRSAEWLRGYTMQVLCSGRKSAKWLQVPSYGCKCCVVVARVTHTI